MAIDFAALEALHKSMIDQLIADSGVVVPCRLYYLGTKFVDCSNCEFGVIGQKNSGNPYYPTGSGSSTSTCSICGGTGKIAVETTDDVNLIVIWEGKKLIKEGVFTAQGDVTTFCSITLMPKIINCTHAVFNTNIEAYKQQKFVRAGDPNPCGLGASHYIYVPWKRS